MNQFLTQTLQTLLKQDERFYFPKNKTLKKNTITELANKLDSKLISLLLSNDETKKEFFQTHENSNCRDVNTENDNNKNYNQKNKNAITIFDKEKFIFYINCYSFLLDSYTAFKTKIGLSIDEKKILKKNQDVSLIFPHKDCILQGGQTKEEDKKNEILYNEILSSEQIDRLKEEKVFTNWRRFNIDNAGNFNNANHVRTSDDDVRTSGDLSVHGLSVDTKKKIKTETKISIKRDENGTIKENLIIKGNNFLVLHSLKKQFAKKIKLIYIDPPYNTGKDSFNYNDNFNHSSWLVFMKNRLEVAKEFLREDGVIAVSCDDSEQAYLKVLMDEIFGRNNFVINFIWQTKKGAQGIVTQNKVVANHENILVFAKNKSNFSFEGLERDGKDFSNPDNDPRGKWKRQYLQRIGMGFSQKTITNPKNGMSWTFETPYSLEKIQKWVKEKTIIFPDNEKKYPARKEFLSDYQNKKQLISSLGLYPTKASTEELYRLFDGQKIFSNPKPEQLISFLIEQTTQEKDIILDYHLGSGTTAAVAHKMERQYIGIEQMDYVKDIVVKRLKKVIDGEQYGISKAVNWCGGGDFIYCELAEYNQKFISQIQQASESNELLEIFEDMQKNGFLSYQFKDEQFRKNLKDFQNLSLKEQKIILIELLDKNMLYINYRDMEDEKYKLDKEVIKLNHKFYKND